MFRIFIPTILQIIITYVLNLFGIKIDFNWIIINYTFTILLFLTIDKKYFWVLFTGYLLRIILMYFNIYFNDIFELPHTGDAKSFYEAGLIYYNNNSINLSNIYGGLYSKFLGMIMLLTNPNRLLLQHINIIFDMSTIIILLRSLNFLNIDNKIIKISILLYTFMPMHIIISSVLMRESIIIFFLSLSLLSIVKYYRYLSLYDLILSFIFLIVGSLFHSAVIFISIGYIYIFTSNMRKITPKEFLFTFIIFILLIFVVYLNRDLVLKKILKNGEINISYGNYKGAESIYLPNLKVNNFKDVLVYGPIRSLYFLISPVPQDWRGLEDIASFALDSMIYILLLYNMILVFFKNILNQKKVLIIGLIISILIFIYIFGIGVNNSGTAIRHRNKILIIIITFLACVYDNRNNIKNRGIENEK